MPGTTIHDPGWGTKGRTHGLIATYVGGCRCVECRDAARTHQNARRAAQRALRTGTDQETILCIGCLTPLLWADGRGKGNMVLHERACFGRTG